MPDDDPQQSEPLDDLANGSYDVRLRFEARLAALDAAVRSLSGSSLSHDPDAVEVRAESFERWLLRERS